MVAVTTSVASMAGMVTVISLFISSFFGIKHISNFDLDFVHNFWGIVVMIVAAVAGCMASMANMVTVISLVFSSFFVICLSKSNHF